MEKAKWVKYHQEILKLSDRETDGLHFIESPKGLEVLVVAHRGCSLDSILVGDKDPGEVVAAASDYLEALTTPGDILGGGDPKAIEIWGEHTRELRNKAAGRT